MSDADFNALLQNNWSGYSPETKVVLEDHAWEAFLNDPDFVAKGDKETLDAMVEMFAGKTKGRSELSTKLARRLVVRSLASNESLEVSKLVELRKKIRKEAGKFDGSSLWQEQFKSGAWESLSLDAKTEMLWAYSYDMLNKKDMSVRWTGAVTAPRSGMYEFLLVRNGIQDPNYKLTIDGAVVFDSSASDTSVSDQFLVGKPVSLVAGEPVSIALGMSHAVSRQTKGECPFPGAVLMWRTEGLSAQVIPSSSLSPPAAYSGSEKTGLLGEYFSKSSFGKSVGQRIDPSLDFVWWKSPCFPKHQEAYQTILDSCFRDALGIAGGSIDLPDGSPPLLELVGPIISRLLLKQRAQLVEALAGNNELLKAADTYGVARMVSMCCMPGGEQLELLDNWSRARPQPRFQPGSAVEGKTQYLATSNKRDDWLWYWFIGKHLTGPHWGCSQAIFDGKLELADGQCNLTLLYIVTFAAYEDQWKSKQPRVSQVRQLLNEKLQGESLSGDARVSWLIGRAFFEEAGSSHPPAWGVGNNFLMEASLVAESEDYRFWAIQELATRYAALGQVQTLENLVQATESKFSNPKQQKLMQECCDMVKHTKEALAEQKQQQRKASAAGYVKGLQQRVDLARSNGRSAAAERFQKLLDKATAKRDSE